MTNKVTKPNQVTAAVVGAWANEVEVTPELVGDWIASKGDYSFSQTDHGWRIRAGEHGRLWIFATLDQLIRYWWIGGPADLARFAATREEA